jgi:hypothetical protein
MEAVVSMNEPADENAERTALRYSEAARAAQDLINRTLTQVSGFTLLLLTSDRSPAMADGALASAAEAAAQALAMARTISVPGTAAHHHHHLVEAATALSEACRLGRQCLRAGDREVERDALTKMIRTASDHLRLTARLLPGFELIDLGQACCAAHAPLRLLAEPA